MSKSDEFQRHADDCLRRAHMSDTASDEAAWLRMAEAWLRLITPAAAGSGKPTLADEFEALSSARGTGQKVSNESH